MFNDDTFRVRRNTKANASGINDADPKALLTVALRAMEVGEKITDGRTAREAMDAL